MIYTSLRENTETDQCMKQTCMHISSFASQLISLIFRRNYYDINEISVVFFATWTELNDF